MRLIILLIVACCFLSGYGQEQFPDGKLVSSWFKVYEKVDINTLGEKYKITDYGVVTDSTRLQTKKIQAVIDLAAENGGGVIVIFEGTFLSGALFFKPKTHLYLEEGAVLKGSDDICHFPVKLTRMEGQILNYFVALVNADGVDGFTISGRGMLDGNGLRYWKSFWLRREVNPDCTNMDELRPRILYLSNCKNVQIDGIKIVNSPFWTTHFYKCSHLKLMNLHITSPHSPIKAPSTDAIDLDICDNVLIKDCYMSVCDDAVALKGGKGPWVDRDPDNGGNYDIIIEDCHYGFCHSALTCGSESVYNRNIIFRRCQVDTPRSLLRLKMRPDTPQRNEYILVEDIKGNVRSFLSVAPWTQFYDLKDRGDIPMSYSDNITMRNIELDCDVFFDVQKSEQYKLSNFNFENLTIHAKKGNVDKSVIDTFVMNNVKINP
jgi:galacturan 1,4-alpha-galacturonidase